MSAVLVHESGGLRFMKPSRDVKTLQLVVNAKVVEEDERSNSPISAL